MKGLLEYTHGDTLIHRLNPLIKLIIAFVLCAGCFVSENHMYVLGVILAAFVLSFLAGIQKKTMNVFLNLLKLSVLLFLLQIFFIRDGSPLIMLPFGLRVTDKGLAFCSLLSMRIIGATLPLTIMLSVTKMVDLSNVLVETMHIPYKYAFSFTTALRFIPLFMEEMHSIMEAQTARGVEFDTKNIIKKIRLMFPLCVPLVVSSVKRIEQSAVAVELRGFSVRGTGAGYKRYPIGIRDICFTLCSALVLVTGLIL